MPLPKRAHPDGDEAASTTAPPPAKKQAKLSPLVARTKQPSAGAVAAASAPAAARAAAGPGPSQAPAAEQGGAGPAAIAPQTSQLDQLLAAMGDKEAGYRTWRVRCCCQLPPAPPARMRGAPAASPAPILLHQINRAGS